MTISSNTFLARDNGIGISKDEQKNLFKKFYQIDTKAKNSFP
jgi:signal transduction histidine kinase